MRGYIRDWIEANSIFGFIRVKKLIEFMDSIDNKTLIPEISNDVDRRALYEAILNHFKEHNRRNL